MRFQVEATYHITHKFEVEADDPEEARQLIVNDIADGEIEVSDLDEGEWIVSDAKSL